MTLTDEQISRWIAEKLGWTAIEICCCEARRLRATDTEGKTKHVDLVNDPAMTAMLLLKLMEHTIEGGHCIAMNDGFFSIDGRPSTRPEFFSRAVAEVFMLANGYEEANE